MKRALVCDDEKHIVRLVQVNLERQGWHVTCAYGGLQALDILRSECFDLVVLDPIMPGTGGYDVRDWINSSEDHNGTEIVMLEGKRSGI